MNTGEWFSLLSVRQRLILLLSGALVLAVAGAGVFSHMHARPKAAVPISVDMTIRQIAPKLNMTGKSLARHLGLPLAVAKDKPLKELEINRKQLESAVTHKLSHGDAGAKYYIFLVWVLFGVVFLNRLGRPDASDMNKRKKGYPRLPYVAALASSVLLAGFYFGKSPNPMEGAVKVFKSAVGLYPDPAGKVAAFLFFLVLALVGNKVVCGWACPFGALQELIYSIPVLQRIKKHKSPFILTNSIRVLLFALMLLFLFGIIGGRKGFVIYHYINPFNLFDMEIENISILLTVLIALFASFFVYRPFCQLICPFGLISWVMERFSLSRVQISMDTCTQCGACIRECPLNAAKDRVYGKRWPSDCFSCGRCLNVCPVDAIHYRPIVNPPIPRLRLGRLFK